MREICTSGSEGGASQLNEMSLPLSVASITNCFKMCGTSLSLRRAWKLAKNHAHPKASGRATRLACFGTENS